MLFYSFDSLDKFMKNTLIQNIKPELDKLEIILKLYEDKKNNLDIIATNFVTDTINVTDEKTDELLSMSSSLKMSYEMLENINRSVSHLKNTLEKIISLCDNGLENNCEEVKAELIEYNTQSDGMYNQIFTFEKNLSSLLSEILNFSSINIKSLKKSKKNTSKAENTDMISSSNFEDITQDNNILIISEKDQKAYLPYKFDAIKKIFDNSNDKYNNLQDVINSLYVLPLNKFKNSSIARFREAFYLIRHKENGSVSKALDLASELMFKHNLNPIIIAACRNLDELDIYLDCLDEKELNQFECFNIRYEVFPKNI